MGLPAARQGTTRPPRQAAHPEQDAGRRPHARSVVLAGVRRDGHVPHPARVRVRRDHARPRCARARPDPAVLAGRGPAHLRPRQRADRLDPAGRRRRRAATRRPHARTVVAAVPRCRGRLPAAPGPRLRRMAAGGRRHRPHRHARRLADRRGPGISPHGRGGHDRPSRERTGTRDAVAPPRGADDPDPRRRDPPVERLRDRPGQRRHGHGRRIGCATGLRRARRRRRHQRDPALRRVRARPPAVGRRPAAPRT